MCESCTQTCASLCCGPDSPHCYNPARGSSARSLSTWKTISHDSIGAKVVWSCPLSLSTPQEECGRPSFNSSPGSHTDNLTCQCGSESTWKGFITAWQIYWKYISHVLIYRTAYMALCWGLVPAITQALPGCVHHDKGHSACHTWLDDFL